MGLIQLYSTAKTSTPTADLSATGSFQSLTFCNCNDEMQRQQQQQQQFQQQRQQQQKPHQSTIQVTEQLNRTFNQSFLNAKNSQMNSNLDVCRCGEDACKTINWTWDNNAIQPQTIIENHTVKFHPYYSQGTSVIRSDAPLENNMIHYWEIKIVHWFTGTDLMVGIGRDDVNLQDHRYSFASVLGLDHRSWGYSHRGMIQHKNVLTYYGKPYTKQCIVGVYLDLSRGILEFYINRIPQGIAFRNIPTNERLYAMVCSTSAKSSVRLINTTSFRDCLQFRCMKIITKYPQLLEKVQHMPGLANLCRDVWFMFPKERYQYSSTKKTSNNIVPQRSMNPDSTQEQKSDPISDLDDSTMETSEYEDSATGSVTSNDDHDINETLFLSTYADSKTEQLESDDDEDLIYDDAD